MCDHMSESFLTQAVVWTGPQRGALSSEEDNNILPFKWASARLAHTSLTPRVTTATEVLATVAANVCGSGRDTSRAARLLPSSEREEWHRVQITSSSEA